MEPQFTFRATMNRVIDADTQNLTVDQGFYNTTTQNFRLARVNAPEIKGEERPEGLEAKSFVFELYSECDNDCIIVSEKHGKYRWVAEVYLDVAKNGKYETNLSDLLVSKGYAIYKEY